MEMMCRQCGRPLNTGFRCSVCIEPIPWEASTLERAKEIARKMWSIHPKELHSANLSREQFYAKHLLAFAQEERVSQREQDAKLAEKWRDENRTAAAAARKSQSEGSQNMAEMLDGAAIECNAIAAAIRDQQEWQ